jgi:hypothetical protein
VERGRVRLEEGWFTREFCAAWSAFPWLQGSHFDDLSCLNPLIDLCDGLGCRRRVVVKGIAHKSFPYLDGVIEGGVILHHHLRTEVQARLAPGRDPQALSRLGREVTWCHTLPQRSQSRRFS